MYAKTERERPWMRVGRLSKNLLVVKDISKHEQMLWIERLVMISINHQSSADEEPTTT